MLELDWTSFQRFQRKYRRYLTENQFSVKYSYQSLYRMVRDMIRTLNSYISKNLAVRRFKQQFKQRGISLSRMASTTARFRKNYDQVSRHCQRCNFCLQFPNFSLNHIDDKVLITYLPISSGFYLTS